MDLLTACRDPNLFAPWFRDPGTWRRGSPSSGAVRARVRGRRGARAVHAVHRAGEGAGGAGARGLARLRAGARQELHDGAVGGVPGVFQGLAAVFGAG